MFAIVVLSILGLLFKNNHPELVGGEEDPVNGPQVAATVFTAVIIYVVGSAAALPQPLSFPVVIRYVQGRD